MSWRGIRTSLVLLGILLAASCAPEQRPAAPRGAPAPAMPRAVGTRAPSAADYVAISGSLDLLVIRSSQLALERSSSRQVRDFAAIEVEAHKGTAAQLSLAGRRLNLLPSAILRPREQQLLDTLEQASNFDAAYVRQERLVHQQALSLDKSYSASGQSVTLRPVALAAAQIIQRHLALLADL
jgi:putative membrane protein